MIDSNAELHGKALFGKWVFSFSGRILVMLIAYADESGTHDDSGRHTGSAACVIGGLVAKREDWDDFCTRWQAVLNKYHTAYFHFRKWAQADAVARNIRAATKSFKKNPYHTWSKSTLDAFLIECATIVGSGKWLKIGGTINTKKLYEAKVKGDVSIGVNPYIECLHWFFKELTSTFENTYPGFNEPVSIIFDHVEDPQWWNAIGGVFYKYQKKHRWLKDISHSPKTERLPLQGADMVAFRSRQIAEDINNGTALNRWPEVDDLMCKAEFQFLERNAEAIFKSLISGAIPFENETPIATLDSTSRSATGGDIQVFRHGQTPTRPYKEIAVYSLASHGGEAANVLQGFIDLARKQGADAIIFDDSGIMMTGSDDDIKDGGVGTFQGTAIVWTDGK